MQSNKHQLPAGMVIGGRYHIVRHIGQGGMAHVYLADDQLDKQSVAIKIMNDDLAHDPEFIKRFDTEAKAASSLDHPNIVKVLGYGQDEDLRYIVQEFVDGSTLNELIMQNGPFDWQEAVPLVIQIGLALEHAHRNGVVHRDIKPHNILITKDWVAKVTDFGIARAIDSNTITLTSGVAFGSVHYFSPEQARGGLISEKSDIYSLGILLHELVTGQLPFDGDTSVAVAIKHLQEMPAPASSLNPDIPRSLDNIITKCIQKSPDNRYSSARDLVDELDAFMVEPNGVYGAVTNNFNHDGSTTAISLQRPESNFAKLREIEKTIINRRRARRRDVAVVVGIVLLASLFLFAIGSWTWQRVTQGLQTPTDSTYEIENYVGRDIAEVESILTQAGVRYTIRYDTNSDVEEDIVIDQNPSPGMVIRPGGGTIVELTVSGARNLITLPDYSGDTMTRARTELEQNYDLIVNVIYEYSEFERGLVIKTIPAAGQRVQRDSEITLVVSDGLPSVRMPNLAGLSLQEAQNQLADLNLILGPMTSMAIDEETGELIELPENQRYVIEQSIEPGEEVIAQTVVSIIYGSRLDYEQYINPTPTPEPSPTPSPSPEPTPTPEPTTTEETTTTTAEPTPTTPTPTPTTPTPTPTTTTTADETTTTTTTTAAEDPEG